MATLSFKVESDVTESLRDMAKLEKTTEKTAGAMRDLSGRFVKASKDTDDLTKETEQLAKASEKPRRLRYAPSVTSRYWASASTAGAV